MSKTKSAFTRSELNHFRKLLLEKRREILHDLQGLQDSMEDPSTPGEQNQGMSNLPTHPADLATDAYDQELDLAFAGRARDRLNEIDQAIDRIEDGSYGICLAQPGEIIDKKRLMAKPWAKYCLEHAQKVRET